MCRVAHRKRLSSGGLPFVVLSILVKMFLDHLMRKLLFGGTPSHYGRVQQIKFLRIKIRMSSKNSAPFIRLAQITHN
jgi:hypothetical protein